MANAPRRFVDAQPDRVSDKTGNSPQAMRTVRSAPGIRSNVVSNKAQRPTPCARPSDKPVTPRQQPHPAVLEQLREKARPQAPEKTYSKTAAVPQMERPNVAKTDDMLSHKDDTHLVQGDHPIESVQTRVLDDASSRQLDAQRGITSPAASMVPREPQTERPRLNPTRISASKPSQN